MPFSSWVRMHHMAAGLAIAAGLLAIPRESFAQG
jgi:hypothetical protein